jgi:hypothetical protein
LQGGGQEDRIEIYMGDHYEDRRKEWINNEGNCKREDRRIE